MAEILETVELLTGASPAAAVIWLHGLGADGHDFEPIVPALGLAASPAVRFVFPHAPVRPVTLNMGMQMRAWYDIVSLDRDGPQDELGIRASSAAIERLIARERERGIAADRIVLAGFSQGGAMALFTGLRHVERLAGLLVMSAYLPLLDRLEEASNVNRTVPILQCHGTWDPLVPMQLGQDSRDVLTEHGYTIDWRTYPIEHSVHPQEIADAGSWLRERLQGS